MPAQAPHGASIIVAKPFSPGPDLTKLITAEARDQGVELVQREDSSDDQLGQIQRDTSPRSGFRTVVVGATDRAGTQRLIEKLGSRSPAVISLLTPIRGAQATIALPEAAVARRLADGAARWAERHGGIGDATVIGPPEGIGTSDWSLPLGKRIAPLIGAALEEHGFTVTTVGAFGAADARAAVAAAPSPVVIGWNDEAARAGGRAVDGPHWVGAVGAPAPQSRGAIDALASRELQLIVGTRLSDLARDIVAAADTPRAAPAPSKAILLPIYDFTPGAEATRRAAMDYSGASP